MASLDFFGAIHQLFKLRCLDLFPDLLNDLLVSAFLFLAHVLVVSFVNQGCFLDVLHGSDRAPSVAPESSVGTVKHLLNRQVALLACGDGIG